MSILIYLPDIIGNSHKAKISDPAFKKDFVVFARYVRDFAHGYGRWRDTNGHVASEPSFAIEIEKTIKRNGCVFVLISFVVVILAVIFVKVFNVIVVDISFEMLIR